MQVHYVHKWVKTNCQLADVQVLLINSLMLSALVHDIIDDTPFSPDLWLSHLDTYDHTPLTMSTLLTVYFILDQFSLIE